jgi:uncharacterized protein YjeT (DUF2065 family)
VIQALLQAAGLVFVIEGLLYALVPSHVKAMLTRLEGMSGEQLRMAGAIALAFGVGLVWLAKLVSN